MLTKLFEDLRQTHLQAIKNELGLEGNVVFACDPPRQVPNPTSGIDGSAVVGSYLEDKRFPKGPHYISIFLWVIARRVVEKAPTCQTDSPLHLVWERKVVCVMAHEMRHAWQWEQGWTKDPPGSSYEKSPKEQDARRFAVSYLKKLRAEEDPARKKEPEWLKEYCRLYGIS